MIVYFVLKNIWYKEGGGVPFVPSDDNAIERIMEFGEVGDNDVFYELGSGDGRLVIAAAMRGAKSYGIEINFLRAFYSNLWCRILRLNNAKIIREDFNKVDLSSATVVAVYLLPEINDKIKNELIKKLKKGTRVLAIGFEFEGWKPEKANKRGVFYGPLRLYRILE